MEFFPRDEEVKVSVVSTTTGFGLSFFYMVQTYLDLIEGLSRPVPTAGLVKYYNYKNGTLNASASNEDLNSLTFQRELRIFANAAIIQNILSIRDMIEDFMKRDIAAKTQCPMFLSNDAISLMHKFGKSHDRWDNSDSTNMWNLSQKLFGVAHHENHQQFNESVLADGADQTLAFFRTIGGLKLDTEDYKKDMLSLLKVFFYLACCYYRVSPSVLISLRKLPNYKEAVKISDTTLAAIPFSPYFVTSCADMEVPSSTKAINYITALAEVYSDLISGYPKIDAPAGA